jgi:hypothetical protein
MLKFSTKQAAIVIGVLVVISGTAFFAMKSLSQPKTFEECVLKNVKGEETDEAVRAIQFACMQLSIAADQPEEVCRDLQQPEIEKLEYGLYARENIAEKTAQLEVRLYNGNEKIKIDSVTIELDHKDFSKPRQYEMKSIGDYALPKSSGIYTEQVGFLVDGKLGKNKILSAKTCEKS